MSLGSSTRDHEVEVELLGERFVIRREGFDGDSKRAADRLAELDGKVDALGLGGIDLYLRAAGRDYRFRAARVFAERVRETPLVCGAAIKGPLEHAAVRHMAGDLGLDLCGKRVLVTSAVDRYGLAQGFHEEGSAVTYGDLLFVLKLPILIRNKAVLERTIRTVTPLVVNLPFSWLYPTGTAQERPPSSTHHDLYRHYDVIAGDFQFVRSLMPPSLPGAWVVTNTTTPADVEFLRSRGVELLVTTTPRFQGRTFGTNVIEAMLVAHAGSRAELSPDEYVRLISAAGIKPDTQWLQSRTGDHVLI